MENKEIVDELSQNYMMMNDIGKKKLKKVADQILKIYETVRGEKPSSTNEKGKKIE